MKLLTAPKSLLLLFLFVISICADAMPHEHSTEFDSVPSVLPSLRVGQQDGQDRRREALAASIPVVPAALRGCGVAQGNLIVCATRYCPDDYCDACSAEFDKCVDKCPIKYCSQIWD